MKVLLTGGAGYIGSHTCVNLLKEGHQVVVYDNFSNSHPRVLKPIEEITGKAVPFVQADVRDEIKLQQTLSEYGCEAVIHFAGLKAVGESVSQPLHYYDNNVTGAICLLQAMEKSKVHRLIFSSSASVYGNPQQLPMTEDHPLNPTSPYAQSKLTIENILRDLYASNPTWKIAILRYFNPVGAHTSGMIGENPLGTPNNLMPFMAQVALGQRDYLPIWGSDYPSPDGTGVRDYIHVVDLANGHVKALEKLDDNGLMTLNLGTGRGYSVLEVVKEFEAITGQPIPRKMSPRRPGDVASCFADPSQAHKRLEWQSHFNLEAMCRDEWNWKKKNPRGYG